MQKFIVFLCTLCANSVLALDLTIYPNYWSKNLIETYTTHSDKYVFLENEESSILGDALNSITSLNAVRSGPAGQQTSLFTRGTNSNHTLVTINGSPITDHSTSNGLTDLGAINTNFASSLHIIKGPMSTLYGADAVGGVIDIQTSKKYLNSINVGVGSNNKKKLGIKANTGKLKQTAN